MVSVHIDISLFTKAAAFGMVSGPLDVPAIPQVGDSISFHFTEPSEAYIGKQELSFEGQLRVTDRIANVDGEVLLLLEDITAATPRDARHLMEMFERLHGLFGDVWEEGPA
jgi:hypothetical protein